MPDRELAGNVQQAIESEADNRIADLHLWRVGPNRCAAIVSLVTHEPRDPAHYKALPANMHGWAHVTVEVNPCAGKTCVSGPSPTA